MKQQSIADGGLQSVPQIAAVHYVYLDFDGELTSYNGEILTVEEVVVEHSGLSEDRIQNILAELNKKYAAEKIVFVTELPETAEYSTIYIGKTDAFKPYGSFSGIAETLDENNENKTDKAFVMLNSTNSNEEIISVIAHETDHLTGTLNHGGEGIEAYAASYLISSGVTSTGISIVTGDSVTVTNGGIANSITMLASGRTNEEDGGVMHISSGGVANHAYIELGTVNVYAGGLLNSAEVSFDPDGQGTGSIIVSSGGTASDISFTGGSMVVSLGGIAEGAIIHTGELTIEHGGVATNTSVGGDLWVYGIANSTTVGANGYLHIFSGGTATDIVAEDGTLLDIVVAPDTYIQGSYNGSAFEMKDAYIADFTVNTGGTIYVSNGLSENTTINSSGLMEVSSGVASNTVVKSRGTLEILGGGVHRGSLSIESGASVRVFNDGIIDFTVAGRTTADVYLINDLSVITGAPTYTVTVDAAQASGTYKLAQGAGNFSGTVTIGDGSVNYGSITVNGEDFVYNGTTYSLDQTNGDLTLTIAGNSTDEPAVFIYSSGTLVSSGTVIDNAIIASGGNDSMHISSGGVANDTVVNYYGFVVVSNGGVANSTTLKANGSIHISSGGTANSASVYTDAQINLKNGGVANNTTINSLGRMHISSGGVANSTTVSSGGHMTISSGGVANSTTVNFYGWMYILSGGVASTTAISSGGWLVISSGGVANSTTVNSSGYMHISSAGETNSTTVNSWGSMGIANGGVADDVVVSSGGCITVYSGGSVTDLNLSAGGMLGGFAFAEDKYWSNITDGSAFIADNVYVIGNSLLVSSGGVANDTTVSSGGHMYISSGGVANSTTVNSWGSMGIANGGVADDVVVSSGGCITVYSGGSVTDLNLSAGGMLGRFAFAEDKYWSNITDGSAFIADNVYVVGNGMHISSGGVANSTTVNSSGYMHISSGGVADNVMVNVSGVVSVSSGGSASIAFNPWQGGTVSSATGATIAYLERDANIYYGGFSSGTIQKADTLDNLVITSGNSAIVYSGGILNSTTVNSYGSMYISSGGTATDIVAEEGAELTITVAHDTYIQGTYAGSAFEMKDAYISGYTVNSYGIMDIYSGGVANSTTVNSRGYVYIYSGGVTENAVINSGKVYVSSGGVATSTTINTYGCLIVYNGGVANNTVIVSGGPSASNVINSYGCMYVSDGGVANDIVINTSGNMYILGGTANRITANSDGKLGVYGGGIANDVTVNSGGSIRISHGAVANSTVINSDGFVIVSNGGVANSTTVNEGRMVIGTGGSANSTTVNSGGSLYLSSGGMANDTVVKSLGSMWVISGDSASGIVAEDGAYLMITVASNTYIQGSYNGSAFEMKDAYISGYTINSGGSMRINSGGVADSTTVSSGAIIISNGGVANDAVVYGNIIISNGGVGNDAVINSGGSMKIASGGVANYAEATSSSYIYISSGGTANSASVYTDAQINIKNGGVANNTTVNSLGRMHISSGGVADSTIVNSSGRMYISNGGVANSTTVNSLGSMYIKKGGVANSTTVNSGGSMHISSGGVAENTTVNSYGNMHISSGGVANSTTVNEGGFMLISSGGVANNTTVNSVGRMYISSGGVANDTTVNSFGGMYISSGGVAEITTVNSGGSMGILNGGTATDIVAEEGAVLTITVAHDTYIQGTYGGSAFEMKDAYISGYTVKSLGYMFIENGGVADSTTVNYLGYMYISSGGVADSTIVNSSGRMYISNGGVANSTTVNHGSMSISSGGVANYIDVNGIVNIYSGASANNILQRDGTILVYSGANVSSLEVTGGWTTIDGGSIHDAELASGGYLKVYSNGEVANLQINDLSFLHLHSGVASDTVVNSGGSVVISSGGVHCGSLEIADGAVVSAAQGGIIDFTVAGRTTADGYLINDLSVITGAPTYTITVSADQAYGTYKLAQGASNFTGTLTIGDGSVNYGSITVNGSTLEYNNTTYNLTQTNGDLTLTIAEKSTNEPAVFIYSSGTLTSFGTIIDNAIIASGSNDSMHISSGGVANSTTVNSGGWMGIRSGGVANSTTVNSGGYMNIYQGVADSTFINSSGNMHIFSGGTATNIVASAGARVTITVASNTYIQGTYAGSAFEMKDAYISGTINSGMNVDVSSGGVANCTTINSSGYMHIKDGGVANSTIVNSGGSLSISSGGVANRTNVNSNGKMNIYNGVADSTFINSSGNMRIFSGGTATNIVASAGAVVTITVASNTYIQGTYAGSAFEMKDAYISGTINSGMNVYVASGGVANNTTVNSLGRMYISSGGVADSTAINSSGTMQISSGGVANSTTVNSGGSVVISSGGVHRGSLEIADGAVVSAAEGGIIDFTVAGRTTADGYLINDLSVITGTPTYTITVSADQASGAYKLAQGAGNFTGTLTIGDGSVNYGSITVNGSDLVYNNITYDLTKTNGDLFLNIVDKTANPVLVYSSGTLTSFGTIIDNAILASGSNDSMHISSGGVANSTAVNSGGYMYISSGGVVNSTTVVSSGRVSVGRGAVADDTTLGFLGSMFITSGSANNVIVSSRGYLHVNRGSATNIVAESGARLVMTVASNTYMQGTYNGSAFEMKDAYLSGYTIDKLNYVRVSKGGLAEDTTINTAGEMRIFNGGVASNTVVDSNGRLYISGGAVHRGTLSADYGARVSAYEGSIIDFTVAGHTPEDDYLISNLSVITGAPVYTITVDARQEAGVYKLAQKAWNMNLAIGDGTVEYGRLTVNGSILKHNGTLYMLKLDLEENLTLSVFNDANIKLYSSGALVSAGNVVEDALLTGIGTDLMQISSGGIADNTTVQAFGSMHIKSGGIASNTTVGSQGVMYISQGAAANGIVADEGAKLTITAAENTYVKGSYNGSALEMTDGRISGLTADLNLKLRVTEGGKASGIVVDRGGHVQINGGAADNTLINTHGVVEVVSGGVASDTTVRERGRLYISGGAAHSGTLTIADGAVVSAYEGSIIDFTIADRTAEDGCLINDLTLINGAPIYTITVSDDQASGVYTLAQGAEGFIGTITAEGIAGLTIGNGTLDYGTITVNGEAVEYNDVVYTLTQTNDELLLNVENNSTPVEVPAAVNIYNRAGDTLLSSGMVIENAVLTSATVHVSSGGVVNNMSATITNMHISSGGLADGTVLGSGGRILISSGGTATDTMVSSGATIKFYSGGTVIDTVIASGGSMALGTSATASNTVVSSGGSMNIYKGAAVSNTVVSSGGYLVISGTHYGSLTIEDGATVSAGGRAIDFTLAGRTAADDYLINDLSLISGNFGCTITVSADQALGTYKLAQGAENFAASSISLYFDGAADYISLTVNGYGYMYNDVTYTVTNTDGNLMLDIFKPVVEYTHNGMFSSGAIVDNAVTDNMRISSGGVANNTTISGGNMRIFNGGVANSTTLSGSMYILSGGVANSTTISGGMMYISSGGVANSIVHSYGSIMISSGGTANDMVLLSGGNIRISRGATLNGVEVNSYGSVMVYAEGVVNSAAVSGYSAALNISSGGVANYTSVTSSGYLRVLKGGSANFAEVGVSGRMIVNTSASASNITLSQGWLSIYGTSAHADYITVLPNGYVYVNAGGTASFTEINGKAARMYVRNGGTASDTVVNSQGRLHISSGGTVIDTTVNSGGSMNIFGGGAASNTVIGSEAYLLISSGGTHCGSLAIESGAKVSAYLGSIIDFTLTGRNAEDDYLINDLTRISGAADYTITLDAYQTPGTYKLAQGAESFTNSITITDGTANYGTISVENAVVYGTDNLYLLEQNSGNLTLSVFSNYPVLIHSSGVLTGHGTVFSGETLSGDHIMRVFNGGTASDTTVNGNMYVYNGGTADSTVLADGTLYIQKGGKAENTTVNADGLVNIASGGAAENTTVNSGGSINIASGGSAGNIIAADGANLNMFVASNTYIQGSYNGSAFEMKDAKISDFAINSGVVMNIANGGTASNTVVADGGEMYIARGGVHCGTLTIADGATVSAASGSTIDFTISGRTAEDGYIINDLSLITGTPNYTITVGEVQVPGSYKLAQGAENFTGSMSVGNGTITYGTVAVNGETLDIGRYNYTLTVDAAGNMLLEVGFNTRVGLSFDPDGFDNDSMDKAVELTGLSGALDQLTIDSADDVDYYKFTLDTAGRAASAITIDFKTWKGNLDLYLYDSEGNLVKEAKSASDNETLSLHKLAAGDYYVKVEGFSGNTNEYTLKWDLPQIVTLNDETECGNDKAHSYHLGKLRESVSLNAAIGETGDEDYFMFVLEKGMTSNDTISITYDSADADLEFYIYGSNGEDLIGRGVKTSDGGFITQTISFAGFKHGVYYVRVASADGGLAEYTLNANITQVEKSNNSTGNSSLDNAENLSILNGNGKIENLAVSTDYEVDYFKFTILEDGSSDDYITINYNFAPGGDIDVDILNAAGERVAYSHSAESSEQISLNKLQAGEYYIKVYGYEGAVNNYSIEYSVTNSQLINSDAFESVEREQGFIDIRQDQTISNLSISAARQDDETTADTFKITLEYDAWKSTKIILSDYCADWQGINYVIKDADGNELRRGIGSEISLAGLKKGDYYLTVDTPEAGHYSNYSITAQGMPDHQQASNDNKWSIFIYMAGDNNLEDEYIKDLMYMHQRKLPAGVEVYVLFDRAEKSNPSGENWNGTRVCKVVYNNGFTDYIEWQQLGNKDEWDTGDVATLETFLDWGMQEGSADNYALIMKDHGTSLGVNSRDDTAKSNMEITEIADLLKNTKYDDLSVVVFDQCLMGSDVVISTMEGAVDYVVASEAIGYTPNQLMRYSNLFKSLEANMTPLEFAQKVVKCSNTSGKVPLTFAAFDTSNTYLTTALNEFAGNAGDFTFADWTALCNAFGSVYNYGDEICAYSDLISVLKETLNYEISPVLREAAEKLIDAVNDNVVKATLNTPVTYGNGLAVFNPVKSSPLMTQYSYAIGSSLNYFTTGIGQTAWGTLLNTVGRLSGDVASSAQEAGDQTFDDFNYSYGNGIKEVVVNIGAFSGNGAIFTNLPIAQKSRFNITILQDGIEGDAIRITAANPQAVITASLIHTIYTDAGEEQTTVLATGKDGVISLAGIDFTEFDDSEFGIIVNSDKNTNYTMSFEADWATGVDRFDFARTGSIDSGKGGNNIQDKATILAAGTYVGLMTYSGDADYYLLNTVYADVLDVTITGEGLTVKEFDAAGNLVETATAANGQYILQVANGNYLYIEGDANIAENLVNSYELKVSDIASAYMESLESGIVQQPQLEVAADLETVVKELTVTVNAAENAKTYYACGSMFGDWIEFTGNLSLTANGRYFFESFIEFENGSGDKERLSSGVKSLNVTNIDNVAPTVEISGNPTEWTNHPVTIDAEATDDGSGIKTVEYSLDNEVWIAESSVTVENNCTVYFKVTDNAGNENIQNVFVTKIDTDAPFLDVSRSTESPTNQDVTLSVTAQDDASGIKSIEYSFDNSYWMSGNSVTVDSNKKVYFKVTDNAGNVNQKTVDVNNIDKVAPTLEIAASTTEATNQDVVLTAQVSDGVVEYYNGEKWVVGSTLTVSKNGTYQFRATDEAGNVTTQSINVNNIDKVAPTLEIAASITEATNQDVVLTAQVSDGVVEYFNGTDWVQGSTLTVSENGTYQFRATDEAGNVTTKHININNIDKVAPTLEIAASITEATNQDVVLTAQVSDGTVEYFNGTEWVQGNTLTVSKNGTYQFRATDEVGNMTEKTIFIGNIDKENPGMPGDFTVDVTDSHATVRWDVCQDNGVAGIKGYYIRYGKTEQLEGNGELVAANSITLKNLELGSWYYQLAALDKAGNISDWSAVQKFEVKPYSPENFHAGEHNLYWDIVPGAASYTVEYSKDNFKTFAVFESTTNNINIYYLPEGQYQCRVKITGDTQYSCNTVWAFDYGLPPQKIVSNNDSNLDVFFATGYTVWGSGYSAQHLGSMHGWEGTLERVSLAGKNKIADIFVGIDANVLILSDAGNGDALFVDDLYTALPERVTDQQARISQIDEIRAGAGNDIVDLTSQRFDFSDHGVTVYGGNGNDTIWANNGENTLFGDAGNDRLVGGSNNDVIVGGSGSDSMHGGGGNDIFCFGENWGKDTVEQLEGGKITLWFESGEESNWDASTLTYTDGSNSVTVSGISAEDITLKFGNDSLSLYDELAGAGCFDDAASEKIFDDKNKGLLA